MFRISLLIFFFLAAGCAKDRFDKGLTEKEYEELAVESVSNKPISVAGIDLWDKGLPNKKYTVIGVVSDKRRVGTFDQTVYKSDMSKLVRKLGGDAGIIIKADTVVVNKVAQGCGSSPTNYNGEYCGENGMADLFSEGGGNREGTNATIEKRLSHVVVIKYAP